MYNKFEKYDALSILLSVKSGDDLIVENVDEAKTLIKKIEPLTRDVEENNKFFRNLTRQLNEYIVCMNHIMST